MAPIDPRRPAIARIWRGRTRTSVADEYTRYLLEHGIAPLEQTALGVQLFRHDQEDETEFVTVSYWESVEAMTRFTGGDARRIHHLDRDTQYLIAIPEGVQILDVVFSCGRTGW